MFLLFSLSTICFVYNGARYCTPHVRLAFLIYLMIPGLYLNSLSIVRQGIAIAILFYGYHFLRDKKYPRFFLTAAVATIFHYTSLFTVPFFLISLKADKIKPFMYFMLIVLSIVMSRLNIKNLLFTYLLGSTRYIAYAAYQDEGISFFKVLVLNAVNIALLLYYRKMNTGDKQMFFLVALATAFVTMFSDVGAITRFSYYFRIFEAALVANVLYMTGKKHTKILAIVVIILGYYGFMFMNSVYHDSTLASFPKLTPYKTMFQ